MDPAHQDPARVDLYWLPLGAGEASGCVRWNGRTFEAMMARQQHREVCDLYHSALVVHLGGDRYVIEMAPAWGNGEPDRGVVSEGAVGLPFLGRSRFFRYEIRRWKNGTIPDIAEAVASPQHLNTDSDRTRRLLDLVSAFPAVTWGRDELHAGEMWNSNSLIAWLIVRSGHHAGAIEMPARGRAPGWSAGLIVAGWQPRRRPLPGELTDPAAGRLRSLGKPGLRAHDLVPSSPVPWRSRLPRLRLWPP